MAIRRQIDFDIDKYVRNSKKLDLSFLDWDVIPEHELSDGDVMSMHYMMDIETHTVIYLRDLLATRAANLCYAHHSSRHKRQRQRASLCLGHSGQWLFRAVG